MILDRRDLLRGLGGFTAATALGEFPPPQSTALPRKADFLIDDGYTYLNAAYTHPIPKVSLDAARRAAERRGTLPPPPPAGGSAAPATVLKALFAELINAKPSEIAYVSSTSAGENLVVRGLELDHTFDGNVVTDGLHFEGAILHLLELKKRGLDVRVVKPTKDFRIDITDLEKVIDRRTKLVEVSSASMYNGFQHDLKAVCDLAHAHGAYVYADVIHSVGAGPFDVRASGVDFAACSTFKWLMGDFGIGFLYVREDLLDRIVRPVMGYYQAPAMEAFYPPNLPAGDYAPISYTLQRSATGVFESGTLAGSAAINVALLTASLNYIRSIGVANIQAHREPLTRKLKQEVPRLGFTLVTPPESTAGVVTFARPTVGQGDLPKRLQAARINVRFSTHWMRLSPSIYNDAADIDRFLAAIS